MALFGRKAAKPQATTIDLREPTPPPAPEFGYPTMCPECGARGYLDSIDPGEKVMYQHCPTCFARWETSEQELANQS